MLCKRPCEFDRASPLRFAPFACKVRSEICSEQNKVTPPGFGRSVIIDPQQLEATQRLYVAVFLAAPSIVGVETCRVNRYVQTYLSLFSDDTRPMPVRLSGARVSFR